MVNENLVKDVVKEPYKYGFVTDIETEKIAKGLNEDIIRLISQMSEVDFIYFRNLFPAQGQLDFFLIYV